MITDINQLDLSKRYTYADYVTWQFDEMVELIRGKVFRMSPAPNISHQEVSGNLFGLIWTYLRKKPCKVFSAPVDVLLPLPPDKRQADQIDTIVQPDICIVCDLAQIDEQKCIGPPDWIIEVLSRATSKKDLTEEYRLYEYAGVQEYWVVHPSEGTVLVYRLNQEGKYYLIRMTPFVIDEIIRPFILPGLEINLNNVFNN